MASRRSRPPTHVGGHVVGQNGRSWEPRRQAWTQPGLDCRKVVWRRQGELDLGRGNILRPKQAQVCGLEIERFTGARVVSRLQKSVRSIFRTSSRGAARRVKMARGSTLRRPSRFDGEGSSAAGDKGARTFARTSQGSRKASFGREVEHRTDGRHSGLIECRHL